MSALRKGLFLVATNPHAGPVEQANVRIVDFRAT